MPSLNTYEFADDFKIVTIREDKSKASKSRLQEAFNSVEEEILQYETKL